MKLSILIPVYNEAATVSVALRRVFDVNYPCEVEVVVVDDGSTDGTAAQLDALDDPRARLVRHPVNRGKGAAIRTAAATATGDYLIICDADLEYAPEEIPRLLAPVLAGAATVVYGTRTFGSSRSGDLLQAVAAGALPRARCAQRRFRHGGRDHRQLLRRGIRPYEVPISYRARSREEGKKLTWRDGVEALWILSRERLAKPKRRAAAGQAGGMPSPGG